MSGVTEFKSPKIAIRRQIPGGDNRSSNRVSTNTELGGADK
jgi:hypothetical protein